jgi:hypothetical protein
MLYPKLFIFFLMTSTLACKQPQAVDPPTAFISNEHVDMKLYLPDPEHGYYRATRFDWSGIIYSLEYGGHQYVGDWKKSHDPLVHEDLTGPADSYGDPGPGFDEAKIGGEFIRIGVGALEKSETEYVWTKTYRILDHGLWEVEQGKDWITFTHTLKRESGWAYIYTKRIELMKDVPGFSIIHSLINKGNKAIHTNQFNHNFFVMDQEVTGPDFSLEFPFILSSEEYNSELVELDQNKLLFKKELSEESTWLTLDGFGESAEDNQVKIVNQKTGAGVQISVDKPLQKIVFWAISSTICTEPYIQLDVLPGDTETWVSEYRLF